MLLKLHPSTINQILRHNFSVNNYVLFNKTIKKFAEWLINALNRVISNNVERLIYYLETNI